MRQRRAKAKAVSPGKLRPPDDANLVTRTLGEIEKPPIELEAATGQPLWLVLALAAAIIFFVTALIVKYL